VWYQLQIERCQPDNVDELSNALEESGAVSITLTDKNDDPILEPELGTMPLWPEIIIQALYEEEMLANHAISNLSRHYPSFQFNLSTLPDQDWERAWMDDFKPQRFGQRLWICPSWSTPPEPEAVNLILDPGLAFGTGTHPTTSLCLQWLDQANLSGKTVIDYGCGSGILALTALKLGAKKLYAVDIDPQALQATQSNASINSIPSEQLDINFPNNLTATAELLIANILLTPLVALRDSFYALLKPKGQLVISGILSEQANTLIEAYQPLFTHQQSKDLEGWSLLVFTRN
jgi:ribosomal protein L11 methyltransferase